MAAGGKRVKAWYLLNQSNTQWYLRHIFFIIIKFIIVKAQAEEHLLSTITNLLNTLLLNFENSSQHKMR